MSACGIIPPDFHREFGARHGCPLPAAHLGPHQSATVKRGLIEWADDDCDCCQPEDHDRCIWWGPLAARAAPETPPLQSTDQREGVNRSDARPRDEPLPLPKSEGQDQ